MCCRMASPAHSPLLCWIELAKTKPAAGGLVVTVRILAPCQADEQMKTCHGTLSAEVLLQPIEFVQYILQCLLRQLALATAK